MFLCKAIIISTKKSFTCKRMNLIARLKNVLVLCIWYGVILCTFLLLNVVPFYNSFQEHCQYLNLSLSFRFLRLSSPHFNMFHYLSKSQFVCCNLFDIFVMNLVVYNTTLILNIHIFNIIIFVVDPGVYGTYSFENDRDFVDVVSNK